MEEKKDMPLSPRHLLQGETTTTRRGFFASAVVLAGAAALAGCGGGGGNNGNGRSNGTYRSFGAGNQATVSVSIDRDGLLTFWVLFSSKAVADYGQSYLDSDGFFTQTFGGFRTFGRVRGGRIEGRTERDTNSSDGFDWTADRYVPSSFQRPNDSLIGTFSGFTQRRGVDYTTFLSVAPDGTATVFSELDIASTSGTDELVFEGVSFDRSGNVPNDGEYFLSLFGDSFALRTSGNSDVLLRITFGASVPSVSLGAGEIVELVLNRQSVNDVRSRGVSGTDRNVSPAALDRIFKALGEGRKAR